MSLDMLIFRSRNHSMILAYLNACSLNRIMIIKGVKYKVTWCRCYIIHSSHPLHSITKVLIVWKLVLQHALLLVFFTYVNFHIIHCTRIVIVGSFGSNR